MRESERRLRIFAKSMRRETTKAEIVLWNRLRELNQRGYKFRRQHPIGPFIADFVHLSGKLVIEIDGATHGRDSRPYDERREEYLRERGWTVVRYWNLDVYADVALVVEDIMGSSIFASGNLSRSRERSICTCKSGEGNSPDGPCPHPNAAAHRSTSPAIAGEVRNPEESPLLALM